MSVAAVCQFLYIKDYDDDDDDDDDDGSPRHTSPITMDGPRDSSDTHSGHSKNPTN